MQKKYKIGFGIVLVLTIIGIIGCACNLIEGTSLPNTIAKLISLLLIVFYAGWGYKKPHGNLLKYLMLACDFMLLFSINKVIKYELQVYVIVRIVEIALISYIAGRLERIEQNKYLVVIVLALSIYCNIKSLGHVHSFIGVIRKITPTIIWLDLCASYFVRYKEHREAGLSDAPKNK